MKEIVKVCKKHGELKIEQVYLLMDECRICMQERRKRYYLKNREKVRERNNIFKKLHYERNKETIRVKQREYRENNRVRVKEIRRDSAKKSALLMTDSYIKRCITNSSILKANDIPDELVELKRDLIKFKRKIKEINHVSEKCK